MNLGRNDQCPCLSGKKYQQFFAAMQFLMNRGLRVPQDVSLLCSGGSPIFEWSEPTVTHIRWDTRP
ncbi:MAG: SEC-C metal-binding domain-containing protein, partial [Verrucomicrobia bacterium]|nr:SEC-C metal-binding domain-containing protein [Verrucomicrobiota bacterium]